MSRGGSRSGAGRKPGDPNEKKRSLTVRLPPDVLDWMDERADDLELSRAEIIEDALRCAQMTDQKTHHASSGTRLNVGLGIAPSIESAFAMGAKSGPNVEEERLAFEAWMLGHCWALSAEWTGSHYRGSDENGENFCPHAMVTRKLWAAWRDRAALAANA